MATLSERVSDIEAGIGYGATADEHDAALHALGELVAERQQAIDERDASRADHRKALRILDKALKREQQAIDALREGLGRTEQLIDEYGEEGEAWVLSHLGTIRGVLDRALVNLGEDKP